METIQLNYGSQQVALEIEGAASVTWLREKDIPAISDLESAFRRAVEEEAVDSPPLKELLGPEDLVTIVISDITRFWMRQDKILEVMVDYLRREIGLPAENIAVLVALGTHRPQTEEELKLLVTPKLYAELQVKNHDCLADDLVYLGTTSFGTEVRINPLAAGRKLILLSGTVHHLMAGYGGGRKSILPGIAAKSTINQNHLHSLSPDRPCSNPLIGMGVLADNPVHADMAEAAAMAKPVFGVNIVVNGRSQHCALIAGHWDRAWQKSCRLVQENMGVPIAKKADVVIVSCGGYPKDINLYQAVKSLLNAAEGVREGGTILFLAECREGGGAPEFFDWIRPLEAGRLDQALRESFSIAGYIFYASCEVSSRCRVFTLSRLPADTLNHMGLGGCASVQELLARVDFTGKDVYIMPYGGNTVPFLTAEDGAGKPGPGNL
ncbi:MAG: nickel-dependent lactate racemase [Peptococcaceae bacterium]|nr:nickel-dependent lactate racemase [Peptococcaceae bacterium]